jgi:hypothetical protein
VLVLPPAVRALEDLPQRDQLLVDAACRHAPRRLARVVPGHRLGRSLLEVAVHRLDRDRVVDRDVALEEAEQRAGLLRVEALGRRRCVAPLQVFEEAFDSAGKGRGLLAGVIRISALSLPPFGDEVGAAAGCAVSAFADRDAVLRPARPPVFPSLVETHPGSLRAPLNHSQKSDSATRSRCPTLRWRISRLMIS